MKKRPKPRHIVCVSDLHVGCQLGLMPSGEIRLSDGGTYRATGFQKKIGRMWSYFWNSFVPKATHGEAYDIVINGETIDGVHHASVTQWSHNLADQARAAVDLLCPLRECCDRLYVIRGTEAHSGKSGQWDEWVAREIGATPTREMLYSRYELWKILGKGLIHFTHHIGTTSASAYESTAVYRELVEAYVDAGRWRDRPPDVIVRGHRHRHLLVEVATGSGHAISVVTPGWQGKTPFGYKVAGARQSQPQFGGIVLSWNEEDGCIHESHKVWRPERDSAE